MTTTAPRLRPARRRGRARSARKLRERAWAARERPRRARRDPRPPLPARRGHRVRRRDRRLVPARPPRRGGHRGRADRLPRRLLHGRGRRRARSRRTRPWCSPTSAPGCHLAECADIYTVRDAWDQMTAALPGKKVIPLTYMNSGADLKAFVGEHGGAVCTSGNAEKAFRWALSEGDAVFFFPDEHLGRNTACRLGMAPGDPLVWNPRHGGPGRPRRGRPRRRRGSSSGRASATSTPAFTVAPDRGGPRRRPGRAA